MRQNEAGLCHRCLGSAAGPAAQTSCLHCLAQVQLIVLQGTYLAEAAVQVLAKVIRAASTRSHASAMHRLQQVHYAHMISNALHKMARQDFALQQNIERTRLHPTVPTLLCLLCKHRLEKSVYSLAALIPRALSSAWP